MNDLLIRNALLLDGRGGPPVTGDLAVRAGRIAALGADCGPARESLDAGGLALMPGIIDNHTHYDAQLTWDPTLSPSPELGVTTAIIGNCGFTIAPCRPADRERVMRNLTQVEGMSLDALRAGIRWDFESVPAYLDQLERSGSVPNIAGFVGHSSVRTFVMGAAATERAAIPEEVAAMQALVTEALAAGAIGFSTSTSPAHNGEGGVPMPSRLADDAELRALAGCLKGTGGVFMLTKGGQTKIDFLESLAADTGRPVVIAALLHNSTNPGAVFKDLDAIAAANARGHRLVGAMSCCPLSFDFTLASPYPIEGMDAWKPALGKHGAAFRAVLADAGFRQAIRDELSRPAVFRIFNGEWDKVHVVECAKPENRKFEQQSIAQLAAASGRDPLDVWFDLALEEDLKTVFVALTMNSDEEAVARMLRHPASMVSLSDAGAHLTFFNDAGYGLHLLGHWVRERGVLSLAEAAQALCARPAQVFGIAGRGVLEAGAAADLLLFDPKTVGRGPKERRHDLPAGAPRLMTPALGVHGVWVNGVRVADEKGRVEAAGTPGRLLRRFTA
ncbi:MAG TPA: amidohydrolase family protein [Burkholderiales bacterium]